MENFKSPLKRLCNAYVTSVTVEDDGIGIGFNNSMSLVIYNRYQLVNATNLQSFMQKKLLSATEDENNARLVFENDFEIIVDLTPDAYVAGPEAMQLLDPTGNDVIW